MSLEGRKKISEALKGTQKNPLSIKKQINTKLKRSKGFSCGFDPIDSKKVKKVRCIETGDVFGSITEAENWANTCKIGECCNGIRAHAGHHPETKQLLSWEYADNNDTITIRCTEKRTTRKIKKIRCIETNEIFNNATEAFNKTGI